MRMQSAEQKKTPWPGPPQTHFSVAKATLELQMSICPSVCLSQKPLSLSESLLSTIEPSDN